MRKLLLFSVLIALLWSCDKKSEVEKAVEEIPVKLELHRFDKAFFEAKPADLPQLKAEYPFFFPPNVPDDAWREKMTDPLWREVHEEVDKKFGSFAKQSAELEDLYKHFKYYFPMIKVPVTYTVIGEMDYHNKVLYAKDTLILSLELYLGKKHKFYVNDFPAYLARGFDEAQLLPDVVSAVADNNIPSDDQTFLGQMVEAGKKLYLMDLMLPEVADNEKINYEPEQLQWCLDNEGYVWRYFVESDLLYNTDPKITARFLEPSPFSKFYLEIDKDSPGRTGAFIGWQIVRAFAENNDKVALKDLLALDAKTLFERSRYKPKKIDE